jgi:hypothetical protein
MGTPGLEKQVFGVRKLDIRATIAALRSRIKVLHSSTKLGREKYLLFNIDSPREVRLPLASLATFSNFRDHLVKKDKFTSHVSF